MRSRTGFALALGTMAVLAMPAAAPGSIVAGSLAGNVYQGVLREGDIDRYPGPFDGLVAGCFFTLVGRDFLVLTAEGLLPGDEVVLWSWEEIDNQYFRVGHAVHHDDPVATATTIAPMAGCPAFEVEGASLAAAAGYTVVACHAWPVCDVPV